MHSRKHFSRIAVCISFAACFLQGSSLGQDLQGQYKSQQACGWETAQYETGNSKVRYFVAKDGNYYKVGDSLFDSDDMDPAKKRCVKGEGRIGYITTERRNSCFFGVNVQCLNTLLEIKTQAVLEGNNLIEYRSTTGGPFTGTPARSILGTLREGFSFGKARKGASSKGKKVSKGSGNSSQKITANAAASSNQSEQNNANVKKQGNSCPAYFAYAGNGVCRKVICDSEALKNDPILGGKNWKCKSEFFMTPSLAWGSEEAKATYDPSCPETPPEPGWQSSCRQKASNNNN